ncbi:MAG: hypothetical protein KKA61_00165 [Nanoarchaeota archaeon]|nr:hypothetical protein [Nanoarchaeota archaeon]MBU4492764.1 hypothetical protein [Nanoarchaeota archaeon]
MVTKLNEIKKLSPEERIKKLKGIKEKNKKEINEAEKLIKDSIREINIQEEIKDLPIPQIKAVDIESLFSPEEKEVFATKRYENARQSHVEEETAEMPLEETVEKEKPEITKEELEAQKQYQILELRREPTENVVQEIENVYRQVRETGGVTGEQMTRAYAANVIAEERQREIERGTYRRISEEISDQLSIAKQIFNSIQEKYKLR